MVVDSLALVAGPEAQHQHVQLLLQQRQGVAGKQILQHQGLVGPSMRLLRHLEASSVQTLLLPWVTSVWTLQQHPGFLSMQALQYQGLVQLSMQTQQQHLEVSSASVQQYQGSVLPSMQTLQ